MSKITVKKRAKKAEEVVPVFIDINEKNYYRYFSKEMSKTLDNMGNEYITFMLLDIYSLLNDRKISENNMINLLNTYKDEWIFHVDIWKEQIKNEEEYLASISEVPDIRGVPCPSCKSERTKTVDIQTRRLDEPSTKFGECFACQLKWTDQ